jgi:hypothetical protein
MPTKRVCYHFRLFCVVCHNAESKEAEIINVLGENIWTEEVGSDGRVQTTA